MKKIFIALIMGFTILLGGCDEAPAGIQYVFDQKEHTNNIKKYALSKGNMDGLAFLMTSILFSKEVWKSAKTGKK